MTLVFYVPNDPLYKEQATALAMQGSGALNPKL